MTILNIAGYKFCALLQLSAWRCTFLRQAEALRGTILLAPEGINLNLAGTASDIQLFKDFLKTESLFADILFRESFSEILPFKKLKVKIKDEIITFREPSVDPVTAKGPSLTPQELKQWLDQARNFTLLDTRNTYEVELGTFKQAEHLDTSDFTDFVAKSQTLAKDKPIVMFCTGGIRCEKASLHLLNAGHKEVYQLEGGILNYFAEVGQEHYTGACFVFDERFALDSNLQSIKK
jgi:UPF0176 protein